jgi:DNA-binding NarL/FixJ family response regulator
LHWIKSIEVQSIHPVIIADTNKVLLDGLAIILGRDPAFRVVGTARNAKELLENAMHGQSIVYLIDYEMYQIEDLRILLLSGKVENGSGIIILTDHWEPSLVKRIMAAGVSGCLPKTCDANELMFAIHQVLTGKIYFSCFAQNETNNSDEESTKVFQTRQ